MADLSLYLGDGSALGGLSPDGQQYILSLDRAELESPDSGMISDISSIPANSGDKVLVGLLNVLWLKTSQYTSDPNYKVVGTSVVQGRLNLGAFDNPVYYDTHDLTFQVRTISNSGLMPDPDNL